MDGLNRDRALALLREAFGADTEFRAGQWEAVECVLEPGSRVLVVQRTGWGKSAVYFLATRLLRDAGSGPTLIVSPLLALMRNQIEMASRMGLRARSINSTNVADWPRLEEEVLTGSVDVLFVSPERLANPGFQSRVAPFFEREAGLLVVDEAHCVSDWGHDFRPDYRRVLALVGNLNPSASILATTATANERVMADLGDIFGQRLKVQRGTLLRTSLRLSAFHLEEHAERLAWLAKYLPRFPGTGIVYVLTVADAETVAGWLRSQNIPVEAYHADLTSERRLELEDRFTNNRLKALVATTALGMGYDKEDVGFVVHYQMPGSAVAYYQQVGRAGRALGTAYGVLLEGSADQRVAEYFIESAVPPRWVFEYVLHGLARGPKMLSEALQGVPAEAGMVKQALEMLHVEGAVRAGPEGFELTDGRRGPDWGRIEGVRERRRLELSQMMEYARLETCRMRFLLSTLGEEDVAPCGRCDNCKPHARVSLDGDVVERARAFLSSRVYRIPPKTRVPLGIEIGRPRTFREAERLRPGIALSAYNDPGWGQMVRDGKYESLEYSEELVRAAAAAVSRTGFDPEWLTWVPSSRHGAMLETFARRLAEALGIEAVAALEKTRPSALQKTMANAQAQFLNVWGTMRARQARRGRCLLVDDIVDSGWTLAVAGLALLEAGSGPVMPFALATATPRRPNE